MDGKGRVYLIFEWWVITDFSESTPTEFWDGEGAGLYHFLVAINDFGEPAPTEPQINVSKV
jgi:hypothetical protein